MADVRRDVFFPEHANTLRRFIPRPGSLSRVWAEFQYSEITGACFVEKTTAQIPNCQDLVKAQLSSHQKTSSDFTSLVDWG